MASCVCGEHDFYVKITPRRNSGDAVARASVAPMQLHRLIRHKGINTWRIIARGGGWGFGAALTISPKTPRFWDFFWKRGKTPKKIIFEGDSKTTKPVVAKKINK
jgi:hypothetical protein